MNSTLQNFAYPQSLICEYRHWVVLIRPLQPTFGCAVVAAKSAVFSFGELTSDEGAELPSVIRDYEATMRRIMPVSKFNYLALMMVDPNPHLHAIPRYADDVVFDGARYRDATYPRLPDLQSSIGPPTPDIESLRRRIAHAWSSDLDSAKV